MEPKKPKLVTIPNLLSLFRLCLIPVIIWLYRSGENTRWAGYLLILSSLTDIADGFIARHYNMVSDVGKVLDPIADKLTQAAMLLCLMLRYPNIIWPLGLLIAKEVFMIVSGCIIIRRTGIVLGANWHGKAATAVLYATMFLHVFWNEIPAVLSQGCITASSGMILLSFVLYGLRNVGLLTEEAFRKENKNAG